MKRLSWLLGALALAASAAGFDEGIDYRAVEAPARAAPGADVEVLEFFWYGCPHCYHLEPDVRRWLTTLPAGVSFARVPAAHAPRWVPHARAFYAAEVLGQLDRLHEPLFKALHEQRRSLMSDAELIAFAVEQGFDEDEFGAAYRSFPVDMRVRKAADLAKRHAIDGVPAFVVNGRFVTSPTLAGGRSQAFEVLNYLIAGERASASSEAAPTSTAGD